MKKGLILFAALFFLASTAVFAKVEAKKEGDVVKVTWTYEGADAGSVGLVGDFNGWNLAGALPMTKDANGVWTITLDGKADSEYKYKFNVDGEWTEDPTAPSTMDDGFGGSNGLVIVADLLSSGGSEGVAKKKGINFGMYMGIRSIYEDSKGGEASETLAFKNYSKFDGYPLENLHMFLELGVADNNKKYYAEHDTERQAKARFAEIGDLFFSQLYSIGSANGNDRWGWLSKLVVTYETPYADVSAYVRWAKQVPYDKFYFTNISEDIDALGGVLEAKKSKLEVAPGMTIDYLAALSNKGRRKASINTGEVNLNTPWGRPNWGAGLGTGPNDWERAQKGAYGSQAMVDLNVGKNLSFGVQWNTRSDQPTTEGYFEKLGNEIALGAKGTFGELNFSTQFMAQFLENTGNDIDKFDAGRNIAYGLKANYEGKMFGIKTDTSLIGTVFFPEMFFGQKNDDGKDDSVERGYVKIKADPYVAIGDLKATLKTTTMTANPLVSDSTTLVGQPKADGDITLTLQPWVDYSLSKTIALSGYAVVAGKVFNTDKGWFGATPNVTDVYNNFFLPEIGLKGELKELVPGVLDSLTISNVFTQQGAFTKASTDNFILDQIMVDAKFPGQLGATLGVVVRSGDAVTIDEKVGFGLRVSKKLEGQKLAGPELFLQVHNMLNMFDADDKGDLKFADDSFRFNNLDQSANPNTYVKIIVGSKWDF